MRKVADFALIIHTFAPIITVSRQVVVVVVVDGGKLGSYLCTLHDGPL